jgi:dienelactone hydrolase
MMHQHMRNPRLTATVAAVLALSATAAFAQDSTARRPPRGSGRPPVVITDTARARMLFVSKDPKDLPGCGAQCARQIANKHRTDSIYAARSAGSYEFKKITYKSRVDGLEIPAYLFSPINKGAKKHAALVWVHGGVHGDWSTGMFPFVREAVERGYVVLTPDYRGSTGYGDAYYKMIDYGGKEVDDVLSAVDYLQTLPYVDMDRLGIMGWSHGAFITSHILFRGTIPFRAGAAIVPVTNLIFRLSDHGPGYQRDYAAQSGIRGLPFENPEEYIRRSPIFHVENLQVPMLVHVATNDCDVFFREDQQMVYTLRALKADLAETKIYVDPPYRPGAAGCGHGFSRRVDPVTLERDDTPEQIDSWNRTWTFFEWNLRPRNVPPKGETALRQRFGR